MNGRPVTLAEPPVRASGWGSAREAPPRGPLRCIDPAIVALTVLGLALASYRLGTKGLELDEAVSADHARLGLSGLWTVISTSDPNMSLYYVLLHFWVRVFGSSEAAVRSMTVVLAGAAAPVMVLLGKRLFSRGAGLIAGLLLVLAPFFLQFEQTARSYALVVLLVELSSYFFVVILERRAHAALVGYVLSSVLAVYAHYFAVYVLLVQLLTLLAVKRRGAFTREWLIAAGTVVVLCVPEVVFALHAGTKNVSWIITPTFGSLIRLPADLAGGHALAVALAILAGYGFVRAIADRHSWQAGFVAAWLTVPVILDFAVSRFGHPLFVNYYLIVVLPAFLLLAAVGVVKLPKRAAGAAVLGLLVVLSAVGIRNWYTHPSLEDFRGATHYILAHAQPGDGIIYYPPGTLGGPTSGIAYYEARTDVRGPKPVRFQLGRAPLVAPTRIWLVIRDSDVPAARRRELEHSVSERYRQVGPPADFRNVTVILYRGREVSDGKHS